MHHFLIVASMLAAGPELTMTPQCKEIHQCDILLVKVVLRNTTEANITIEPTDSILNRLRYERKLGDKWIRIPIMSEYGLTLDGVPGKDPIIESGGSYAEYNRILLHGQGFVFGEPGEYVLRAWGRSSGERVVSEPVTIVVKPRPPDDLRKIRADPKLVWAACNSISNRPNPREATELRDLGGTIQTAMENCDLLRQIMVEERRHDEDVFKVIRGKMDPINAEFCIHTLGSYYQLKRDYANLQRVVKEIPDPTMLTWEWSRILDFQALKTLPRLVVPEKPPKP